MKVQFTKDIAIAALGGRFQAGQALDVDEALVNMLVEGGYAVIVTEDSSAAEDNKPAAVDTAPAPRRKRKADA